MRLRGIGCLIDKQGRNRAAKGEAMATMIEQLEEAKAAAERYRRLAVVLLLRLGGEATVHNAEISAAGVGTIEQVAMLELKTSVFRLAGQGDDCRSSPG
jgi:hypothetical protein